MREIKFRGLGKGSLWVYGLPCKGSYSFAMNMQHWLMQDEIGMQPIIINTLGQYTGLNDRNSTPVYEGDVIKIIDGSINGIHMHRPNMEVKILNGSVNLPLWVRKEEWDSTHYIEVIGNIHENPELLEDGNV